MEGSCVPLFDYQSVINEFAKTPGFEVSTYLKILINAFSFLLAFLRN